MECVQKQDFFMNTIVEQKIYSKHAADVYQSAAEEIVRLEDALSFFKEDSEISRLNKMAGLSPVELSSEVTGVLHMAYRFSEYSKGAFDITIAPLTDLFRRCKKLSCLPDQKEVEKLLPLVDYRKMLVDRNINTVYLKEKGSCVDLGGIGKGYAADACIRLYQSCGVSSAFVNFGGNVKTLGRKPDGKDWVIGIQHPDKTRGNYLGVVSVSDQSVVTSGGYERYYEVGGFRYHHILDPRTGLPVRTDIKSVTVICENSMQADALSTAAFVLGLREGRDLINEFADTQAVFVTETNDIYITKGIQDKFCLSEIEEGCKCYAF